jgi:hypothetical protein
VSTRYARRRPERRVYRREGAARRAYLAVCAALDTPPRNVRLTPRQARRLVRRDLIGALA